MGVDGEASDEESTRLVNAPFSVNRSEEDGVMPSPIITDSLGSVKDFLLTDTLKDHGQSSIYRTMFNVICTVVGSGLLQLPQAVALIGWIGIPFLIAFGFYAMYTAVLIAKCMEPPDGSYLVSYADIGRKAFGRWGAIVTETMVHISCIGSAILYMILAGTNLQQLITQIPIGDNEYYMLFNLSAVLGILLVAEILWGHVLLKTVHEIGILSAFNLGLAIFLVLLVSAECIANPLPNKPDHSIATYKHFVLAYGGSLTSMAFSFGCHSVLPTFREHMKKKSQYNLMVFISFSIILVMYSTLSGVGYYTYGTQTASPIYNNLCSDSCSFAAALGKWIAIFLVTIHVMACFVVSLNPSEEIFEKKMKVDDKTYPFIWRLCFRSALFLAMVVVGISIPDFSDFLDLVSSLSTANLVLLLPPLYYTKLFWHQMPMWRKVAHIIMICIAIYVAFFGLTFAVLSILCDVFGVNGACKIANASASAAAGS